MALASKLLAVSQPDHAPATTPRATCSATGGLDAETFRGFQLAGELFLLTSFFIEPKGQANSERVRDWAPLVTREPISRFLPPMPFSLREPNPPSIGHFRGGGGNAPSTGSAEDLGMKESGSANVRKFDLTLLRGSSELYT